MGLAAWVEAGKADLWPAVVVPETSFRLSGVEPGRYTWRLEDGREPQGPGLVSQRALVFERNDLVSLELAPGLSGGAPVRAGQALAIMHSSLLEEQSRTLQAELALVDARKALLVAGARPETVRSAQKALEVAKAAAEGTRPVLEREARLASAGVSSPAELEDAALRARVTALEADLAAAKLAEVKAGPRTEEIAALDAERESASAKLAENTARLADNQLVSPIDGQLVLGAVVEPDGATTVLRVLGTDPLVLRVPVPQHSRANVNVGQQLRFKSAALPGGSRDARVLAIASEAVPLNGQQVFWLTAALDNPDGHVSPGITGWASPTGTPQ